MDQFHDFALKHGIDNILLAAPNTSQSRLGQILSKTRGFLYLVSLYGVTGPRETLSPQALETLKRVKSFAKDRIPISAGFGISSSDQVQTLMRSGADGAIVGSALVKIAAEHLDNPHEAAVQLKDRVAELKESTRKSIL
jgi:tryptophan synthase alpha chain